MAGSVSQAASSAARESKSFSRSPRLEHRTGTAREIEGQARTAAAGERQFLVCDDFVLLPEFERAGRGFRIRGAGELHEDPANARRARAGR